MEVPPLVVVGMVMNRPVCVPMEMGVSVPSRGPAHAPGGVQEAEDDEPPGSP